MKRIGFVLVSAVGYLSLSGKALAQTVPTISLQPPTPPTPLNVVLNNILTLVYTVATLLVVAYVIWGSVQWIISGGEKEAVANARRRITHALIGLALLASSFFILQVVFGILGWNWPNAFPSIFNNPKA